MALALFGTFAALVVLNVPIGVALGMASVITLLLQGSMPVSLVAQRMYTAMDSFPMLALPFFLLAGELMEEGGISDRLVRFASTLVGHIRAGIAMVAIVTSMFFAAISGSAVATAAAIGGILIPAMLERGYDRDFAAAVIATSGPIGVIIPPSVPMVVYGVSAGVSIGNMFLGGFLPGVLIGLSLMVVAYLVGGRRGYVGEKRASLNEVWVAFKESILALFMPVIILGGVIGGVFTPTEAAAIAVVYSAVVGSICYKGLKWEKIPKILANTATGTGTIMLIIGTASLFGWLLTAYQIPQMVGNLLLSISSNPVVILLIINVILVIVGTFMETNAAIIMLTPILLPVVKSLGVDPIFFGVMMAINLAIGMVTPPVGVTLYVACNIAQKTIREVAPLAMAFLLGPVLVLLLTVLFPQIILYLPRVFGIG